MVAVRRVLHGADRALLRLPLPVKLVVARNGLRVLAVIDGVREGVRCVQTEWAAIEDRIDAGHDHLNNNREQPHD